MIDLHTHLYPEADDRCLRGLDELLNYHYVLGEFYTASGKLKSDIQLFNRKSKSERSEEIWDTLLKGKLWNPKYNSEHVNGILTCVNQFSGTWHYDSYADILEGYKAPTMKEVMKIIGLEKVVATYEPNEKYLSDDNIIPSIRIDKYSDVTRPADTNALYYSFSCESKELHVFDRLNGNLFNDLTDNNIPFWIMLGVRRDVTPYMGLGGDSIGECNILKLVEFANNHPELKIPFSILDPSKIHEAIVASRVTPNLFFAGHWWFNNIPSAIKQNMQTAVDLIGYENFIHYYSDARVVDQLLYKWRHYNQTKLNLGYELHLSDGRLRQTLFGARSV